MKIVQTSFPTDEPVPLVDVKDQGGIDEDDADELLLKFIAEARRHFEDQTRRVLRTTEFKLYLDEFPDDQIIIPRAPIQTIDKIEYVDADGELQEWDDFNYYVDTLGIVGRVVPVSSFPCNTSAQCNDHGFVASEGIVMFGAC